MWIKMSLSGTVLFDQIQSCRYVPVTLHIKLCSKQLDAHKHIFTDSHHTHALSPARHAYRNTSTRTVWMHAHRKGQKGFSTLKFTAGCLKLLENQVHPTHSPLLPSVFVPYRKITIVRGVNSGFWPLHALTHRLLRIKERGESSERGAEKKRGKQRMIERLHGRLHTVICVRVQSTYGHMQTYSTHMLVQ